jgi:hypothetical protein
VSPMGRDRALCNGPGCDRTYRVAARPGPDPLHHFCSQECLDRYNALYKRKVLR